MLERDYPADELDEAILERLMSCDDEAETLRQQGFKADEIAAARRFAETKLIRTIERLGRFQIAALFLPDTPDFVFGAPRDQIIQAYADDMGLSAEGLLEYLKTLGLADADGGVLPQAAEKELRCKFRLAADREIPLSDTKRINALLRAVESPLTFFYGTLEATRPFAIVGRSETRGACHFLREESAKTPSAVIQSPVLFSNIQIIVRSSCIGQIAGMKWLPLLEAEPALLTPAERFAINAMKRTIPDNWASRQLEIVTTLEDECTLFAKALESIYRFIDAGAPELSSFIAGGILSKDFAFVNDFLSVWANLIGPVAEYLEYGDRAASRLWIWIADYEYFQPALQRAGDLCRAIVVSCINPVNGLDTAALARKIAWFHTAMETEVLESFKILLRRACDAKVPSADQWLPLDNPAITRRIELAMKFSRDSVRDPVLYQNLLWANRLLLLKKQNPEAFGAFSREVRQLQDRMMLHLAKIAGIAEPDLDGIGAYVASRIAACDTG